MFSLIGTRLQSLMQIMINNHGLRAKFAPKQTGNEICEALILK